MRRDRKACGFATVDCVLEFGERVVAIDARERQVVCSLQPDFDDDRLFAVELGEVIDFVLLKAVWACADGKPSNLFVLDNRVDDALQVLQRGVRVGVWLQVGEDACVRILVAKFRDEFFELFLNRNLCLVKDGAKTAVVAVAASRKSLGAVEVWAAHASVEGELAHLEVVGEQFQK